jgi:hypothetical protein
MHPATEDVRVRYVRVINNTDQVWSDRHDGVPVTLQPGDSENIPLDMAAHFFGYSTNVKPVTMLNHMARRQGWNFGDFTVQDPAVRQRLADEFFAKFVIEPVSYRLVPEEQAPKRKANAPVPALTDEEVDNSIREPTDVKDLARTGMRDPDAEPPVSPGRGHPRKDPHGRRRE